MIILIIYLTCNQRLFYYIFQVITMVSLAMGLGIQQYSYKAFQTITTLASGVASSSAIWYLQLWEVASSIALWYLQLLGLASVVFLQRFSSYYYISQQDSIQQCNMVSLAMGGSIQYHSMVSLAIGISFKQYLFKVYYFMIITMVSLAMGVSIQQYSYKGFYVITILLVGQHPVVQYGIFSYGS